MDYSMRYWDFQIRQNGNNIKALYALKAKSKGFDKKSTFF